jgi:hypothetical protein
MMDQVRSSSSSRRMYPSQQSCERWSLKTRLVTIPLFSDVSVDIIIYTLLNNTDFDIFILFLYVWTPGHIYGLPGFVLKTRVLHFVLLL